MSAETRGTIFENPIQALTSFPPKIPYESNYLQEDDLWAAMLFALLVALLLCHGVSSEQQQRRTKFHRQPHVLLILADDLGFNDVPWHNPSIQVRKKGTSGNLYIMSNMKSFFSYKLYWICLVEGIFRAIIVMMLDNFTMANIPLVDDLGPFWVHWTLWSFSGKK